MHMSDREVALVHMSDREVALVHMSDGTVKAKIILPKIDPRINFRCQISSRGIQTIGQNLHQDHF